METLQPVIARDLLALWRHEARSLLVYIAGGTSPVVVDELDKSVVASLTRFHGEELRLQLRVLELLRSGGVRPDNAPTPLGAPAYNFMRPTVLGRVFCELAKQDILALAAIRERHAGGTELHERLLRYIIDDAVKLRETVVAELSKALGLGEAAPSVVAVPAAAVPVAQAAAAPTGPAWHDEALSIEERMALVDGKGLFEKLFAAMAQTDCTACGYDCEGYARAIADGQDKDISKCSPGGDETKIMLKKLMTK